MALTIIDGPGSEFTFGTSDLLSTTLPPSGGPATLISACTDPYLICAMEAHPGLAAWAQFGSNLILLAITVIASTVPLWIERTRNRREEDHHLRQAAEAMNLLTYEVFVRSAHLFRDYEDRQPLEAWKSNFDMGLAKAETHLNSMRSQRMISKLRSILSGLRSHQEALIRFECEGNPYSLEDHKCTTAQTTALEATIQGIQARLPYSSQWMPLRSRFQLWSSPYKGAAWAAVYKIKQSFNRFGGWARGRFSAQTEER